jgi:hypothetical protein
MALEVVENSWEGSSASVVLHNNSSAVSTPGRRRSSGANATTEARVYDVKLDSGELHLHLARRHLALVLNTSAQRQNKCLTDKATLRIRPGFEGPTDAFQEEDITYTIAVYSDANLDIGRTSVVYPYENTVSLPQTAFGEPANSAGFRSPSILSDVPPVGTLVCRHICTTRSIASRSARIRPRHLPAHPQA